MKKLFVLMTAMFLFTGITFGQQEILKETFGEGTGFFRDPQSAFGKWDNPDVFDVDTIPVSVRNGTSSSGYAEASGENYAEMGPWTDGHDTLLMKVPASDWADIHISWGHYNNSDWDGIRDHSFNLWYSTNGADWTQAPNNTVGTDTFPGRKEWGWVSLDESLPSADTLYIMFDNHDANHQFFIDDILLTGKSKIAHLDSIKVGDEILESFSAGTNVYTVELTEGTTTPPTIEAFPIESALADVTQADAIPGKALITVTAEDDETTNTYEVRFTYPSVIGDQTLFQESFGEGDSYTLITESDFSKYDNSDNFNVDSVEILIRNLTPSTGYAAASGENYVDMQGHWEWDGSDKSDTLVITSIDTRGYKDIHLSFGIYNNTGWGGITNHAFEAYYSTDGVNWTYIDKNYTAGGNDFPANEAWGWVTLGDELPATETLHLFFPNLAENPHEYYIDDITISANMISDNADLSDLSVDAGTLSPDFDAATTEYTVTVPSGTTETPTVTVTTDDANASYAIDDATDVQSGTEADRTTTITVTAEDATTEKVYTVVFDGVVGIKEFAAGEFTVYPNPVNDQLNFNNNNRFDRISIFSVTGQQVMNFNNVPSGKVSLNVAKLQSGAYIVKFYNANNELGSSRMLKR